MLRTNKKMSFVLLVSAITCIFWLLSWVTPTEFKSINTIFKTAAFAQSALEKGLKNDNWKKHQEEFLDKHKDSKGKVRPDLWRKGIKEFKKMKIGAGIPVAPSQTLFGAPAQGGVSGVEWTQIGPQPLRIDKEQNYQGAGPDSGLVTDIAIDPRNTTDQVVYMSVNDGGIWKTTDGGVTWKPKADFMQSLSMGAVALDPANPSIVYAGTGNNYDPGGIFFKGVGIYRSIDSGETWAHLNPNSMFDDIGINRIVLPSSGVLLVGTNSGLYRSIDNGLHFGNNAPSFDNGAPVRNGYISDLDIDTDTATTIYASVSGQGIFVSTDGGATFPAASNLFSNPGAPAAGSYLFTVFAQSTMDSGSANSQIMYALVQNSANTGSANLFRSPDGGANWTVMPDAYQRSLENNGCQCGYDQTLGVDPQDPDRVYIGFQELYLSTDGGASFGTPAITRNKVHWDHHAIVFSPQSHWGPAPTGVWIGTDGGISSSSDGGSNWANLNETIATQHIHHLDIGRNSDFNNGYSYAGTWDTGTVQHRPTYPGNDWHLAVDGDGGWVAVSQDDPDTAYGTDNLAFMRTQNGGNDWDFSQGAGLQQCGNCFTQKCVVALAVDPNDGATVFASSGCTRTDLYRSTDSGANFSLVNSFPARISAVGTVGADSNTLWIGLVNGTVQRTADALAPTPTWTSIAVTGAPNQMVTGIAINPFNTSEVVVVYPGFCGNLCAAGNRTRHVFRTADNGATWTDISGTDGNPSQNLPDLPVHSAVIDTGTTPATIIVSNDAGVLRSANLGATWEVLGVGLPTVDCKQLALDDTITPSLLRIGTYGRSAFELTAAAGPLIAVNADLGFGFTSCIGDNSTRIVQIFNVGSEDLHISSFFRLSGSTDFKIISGPSTPVTIPPGEEIDFTIEFKPTVAGDEVAIFQINSDDPYQPAKQLSASGTGVSSKMTTVMSDNGDFGDVCIGSFRDLDLVINSSGPCDLSVTNISSASSEFEMAQVVSFPLIIHAGDSISIPIRFKPTSAGAKATNITIDSSDGTRSLIVSGNAPLGDITVTGSTDFGDICAGDLAEKTVSVCNTGLCNLNVNSASIDCPDFTLINNPFPAAVSPDSCLEIVVRFTPTSAGPKTCTLTITSDDPDAPAVTQTLTANTPLGSIDVPPDQGFPPTVIQSVGVCKSSELFPISNTGSCNLKITNISITANPDEFSLMGLPSFPIILEPGHVAGEGALNTIFAPDNLSRPLTGVVSVTYVSEPITGATTTVTRALCGEGVRTGARVLVTKAGVPLDLVKSIKLQRLGPKKNKNLLDTIDNATNLTLQTVPLSSPCATFQYHREYGTVSNPIQLAPGSYAVTVQAIINGKLKKKTVGFDVSSCDFNPNIVVNF